MKINHTELLMPAGSLESFYQALYNGADAVYLGMQQFSARAASNNFTKDEYLEAIKAAHQAYVKIYVTINTLLDTDEFESALTLIDFLYLNQVDAIIIQDIGLLEVCSVRYPGLDIHISTQMFIHNLQGIQFLKQYGVSRIVVARETPIALIKEMTRLDIEIEVFVYGALCTSYSGQCLMSSVTKQRSANKGACAQLCRLPYQLILDKQKIEEGYLLSLKDLNLLDHIDDLVASNISSFKIEGRMKRSEYVGYVTRVFRDKLDALQRQQGYMLTPSIDSNLKKLFNRGFTTGYVYQQDKPFNHYRPNHVGIQLGKIIRIHNGQLSVLLTHDLNQQDGLRILGKSQDYGYVANKIYKDGLLVNHALTGETIELDFKERVTVGDELLLTSDIKQLEEIQTYTKEYYRKRIITVSIEISVGNSILLKAWDQGRRFIIKGDEFVQAAIKAPLTTEKLKTQLSKIDVKPFELDISVKMTEDVFVSVNQLNKLKRGLIELVEAAQQRVYYQRNIQVYEKKLEMIDQTNLKIVELSNLNQKLLCNADHYISINPKLQNTIVERISPLVYEAQNIQSRYIQSLSDLWNNPHQDLIALTTLNVTNPYALAFLYRHNVKLVFISTELNNSQIDKLIKSFKHIFGFIPNIGVWKYGRRNLMNMKYCVIKSVLNKPDHCMECINKQYYLRHKDSNFPIFSDYHCHQIILEEKPLENHQTHPLIKNEFIRYTIE